ncbi:MAG: transcription termination factor NusA [Culicoidibacterales bacterium]
MNTREFLKALNLLVEEKGLDKEFVLESVRQALEHAYKKNFDQLQNVEVEIDEKKGRVAVYALKNVVDDVMDPFEDILIEEAKLINPRVELGDIVRCEIEANDFERVAAQTAKNVVLQKIREAERDLIYKEFIDREQDIVNGTVTRLEGDNIYINIGKTEAILPKFDQMPTEHLRHEETVKVFINRIDRTSKGALIRVSRTSPGLLKRLFELEVPEIFDGTIEVKSVVREAGDRSKIAVHSADETIDAVGACVGPQGMRVQNIVTELKGEKIDIIEWSETPEVYISNALSPAKVTTVILDAEDEERMSIVVVPDDQLSLAIGKQGQNARLAARLTSWKIDIINETEATEQGLI